MIDNKIAILIFAKSAQAEAFAKPFKSSDLLFDVLNQETLKKVRATGLPYFQYSEKEQVGQSFAERFTNAIQSVYNKGFDTVITIGNDTPHLKSVQILKAAQQLETHDIVLGPSFDGGFYLMGLKKSHFNAETFLKLPWQTSKLSSSIFRLNVKRTKLFTLEFLSDIDTISDVKFILHSKKHISSSLKQILSDVISDEKTVFFLYKSFLQNSFQNQYFNKGSPLLIQA